ncbi:MAG TPA: flagellar protein FliT [Herbaspirillum sp.]|jgi:flagellar protein FliT|nr:flagellar protein FliT [Herbaspirillum sp.]
MDAPVDTLPIYENMALISAQMLDAARNGNWDLLALLESRSAHYLKQLKQNDIDGGAVETGIDNSNDNLRERKVAIIKKILADDRDIRSLTEPRVTELAQLISNTSNERKLLRAYGVSKES